MHTFTKVDLDALLTLEDCASRTRETGPRNLTPENNSA